MTSYSRNEGGEHQNLSQKYTDYIKDTNHANIQHCLDKIGKGTKFNSFLSEFFKQTQWRRAEEEFKNFVK